MKFRLYMIAVVVLLTSFALEAQDAGQRHVTPVKPSTNKVLRPAKVMAQVIPGAVALQDGAWIQIDPETGIDLGGDPNILQAPKASGQGSQSWSGTLVQVEKYNGPLTLDADKDRPLVMPVGVE